MFLSTIAYKIWYVLLHIKYFSIRYNFHKLVTLSHIHTSPSNAAQFRSPLTKQCINAETSQHWPTVNDGGRPLEHINLDHATVEDDTTRFRCLSCGDNVFPDDEGRNDEGDDRVVTLANWRFHESFSCGFGSWLCNGFPCQLISIVLCCLIDWFIVDMRVIDDWFLLFESMSVFVEWF